MTLFQSQEFAQYMAALCLQLCGGAPAAWCWAKGSSELTRVTPAASGLRFIYLGMETSIQQTQQDSELALEAADITGNIKLLCHTSSLNGNWNMSILMLSPWHFSLSFS